MRLSYKEYELGGETVDKISHEVKNYMNELKAETRGIIRARLTIEEVLLSLLDHYGDGLKINVGIGKRFGQSVFRVRYEAEPFDPVKNSEYPLTDEILCSLGLFPAWSYRGNINTVSLALSDKRRFGLGFFIILSVLAAVLCGFGGNILSENTRQNIMEYGLVPMADGFFGLLRTFSGLMIAFTICNGIIGMGDTATFGRVGKTILSRIIAYSFALCIIATPITMLFVKMDYSTDYNGKSSAIGQVSQMIFDIIPKNFIDPFTTGNSLQIIVIASIIGVGLISIGERGSHVQNFINETTILMQHIISNVCIFVPVFIFATLTRQIWSNQVKGVFVFIKPLILPLVMTFVITVVVLVITALHLKMSPITLIKKLYPPFLIAISTASSMTALPLAMDTCEKEFGIKKSTISFVMPLGAVIYMPASIIQMTTTAFTFAEIYNVKISAAWILMVLFIVPLNAIAMPPIPGAGAIILTILFTSLGIPVEAIVFAVALDLVFDFFNTGFNILNLMLFSVWHGKKLDKMDDLKSVTKKAI